MLPLGANQSVFYIVENGIVEKEWFLLHKTYLSPPPLEIDFVQTFPACLDCTSAKEKGL